jgi:hypothetical protein
VVVAYTVVAASVIVENIITVMGCISVQVPLVIEGCVALGAEGERVPLRRSVVPVGLAGIEELAVGKEKPDEGPIPVGPMMTEELAVGNGKLGEGAVPVGSGKDEFAVGKWKLAEGAVPVGTANVELLIGKGKLADGTFEVVFKLGITVLRRTETVVLVTKVDVRGAKLPVRSWVGVEPENMPDPVPVGPTRIEALEKAYGVVKGTAVPDRLSPEDDTEKGLEVVALTDGEGDPLESPVKEGGTYAPLELLYRGTLVGMVPLMGNDGVGVGKEVGGDSEPERPAFELEPENGDEAVR